ncbi:MAG: flagellar biosynthesis anti-sigma factor FlgM [Deltaproteobacteria bacterium]|nr:flagellar biosynthesis anti-sigma factor FlgM [Deltaproteobacteria bacterium]
MNNLLLVNKTDSQKQGVTDKGTLAISSGEESTVKAGDTVSISERSRLIAKATELATLAPDVRSEKIAELTARIASGNYKVSSLDVADSILKKSFSEIV